MPQSEEIGSQVEGLLKDFLGDLGLSVTAQSASGGTLPPEIIPEDLRLMNSGSQHGLDLNWVIKFSNLGQEYTWYFEAKGHGYMKYLSNKTKKYESFHISLISDKLLQALSYHGREIHCWCLFAPYLKLDQTDKAELKKIAEYLPFRLVIWDKDFLSMRLKSINQNLFSPLYPLDPGPTAADNQPLIKDSLLLKIKNQSVEGQFWNLVHSRYWSLRREIVNRCQHDLIFESTPQSLPVARGDIPRASITSYYFLYKNVRYVVNKNDLNGANDLEGIKRLLSVAKDDQGRTLLNSFTSFLNFNENPYMFVSVRHRSGDFRGALPFHLLTASTNLGCNNDKPILFKLIEENI